MDRWEQTKIASAVACAVAVVFASSWLAGQVMKPNYPGKSAYTVDGIASVDLASLQRSWPAGLDPAGGQQKLRSYIAHIDQAVVLTAAGGAPQAALAAPVDLGTMLAGANAERGQSVAKVCGSCHTVESGGPNRVGPNLWGLVGRPVGKHAGFAYSQAMAGHGGSWTWEQLDGYLTSPAKAVPGTKMSFAGIRNPKDRANLLAYLGTLGSGAPPYPPPHAPPPVAAEPANRGK